MAVRLPRWAPAAPCPSIVGNEYDIEVDASTATNGYEQSETFISLPNTVFQLLSVSSTYTADSSATVSSPNDKLYGDACLWDPNPSSPSYRSCLSIGKVGGDITETYHVKILTVPGAPLGNPVPLSTLVYDFSGSSYHYNADFGASARFAQVASPATIAKSFSPNTSLPKRTFDADLHHQKQQHEFVERSQLCRYYRLALRS